MAKTTARGAATGSAGRQSPEQAAVSPQWAQQGETLTTALGVRVQDTDNSLRAGSRGPTLMEDFHLREKIMHFDHERIPERVVHARGAAAHGHFVLETPIAEITSAAFLTIQKTTPVFVRFSTVAGSRGSADTARDVRGFAVKFYTEDGNFDLVGNNMPVFFIQDGIKFPDVIHAAKPEPDREIPQAQTAHDTFWDFVSLTPESTHMLMWAMSDRAIPRSFRTMEGFGVHTFRLVNAAGRSTLVKFHWKPVAGIHSLVWEESQKLGGIDPDFHRRDLWTAIEAGAFPEWELGLQLMPDTEDQTFEGIDLLDPTKLVPEELAPVRRIGRLTLDRNPANFFAETEQVAFCAGSFVRGIEPTDDPLLHARMFSYLDTQITRLGGPNFNQIPINRALAPVNDNLRDGHGQQAVAEGRAPYIPNSVGGGCPWHTKDGAGGGYTVLPRVVNGPKIRERALSFEDHYTQAALFWRSMSAVEQAHIVGGFSFELSHVETVPIRERMLERLACVDTDLTRQVAANLGLKAPKGRPPGKLKPSPALSMLPAKPGPIDGRVIAVIGRRRRGRRRGQGGPRGLLGGRGRRPRRGAARGGADGRRRQDGRGHQDALRRAVGRVRRRGRRRERRHRHAGRARGGAVPAGGLPAPQDDRRLGRRRVRADRGRHRAGRRRGGREDRRRPECAPGRRRAAAPALGPRLRSGVGRRAEPARDQLPVDSSPSRKAAKPVGARASRRPLVSTGASAMARRSSPASPRWRQRVTSSCAASGSQPPTCR